MLDLVLRENIVLRSGGLADEVAIALNMIELVLRSPYPRYYSLTREYGEVGVSARKMQEKCGTLVQWPLCAQQESTIDYHSYQIQWDERMVLPQP